MRVTPKMGMFKAGFVFEPVLAADEELRKALADCTWVTSGATAKTWFAENRESMKDKAASATEKEKRAIVNHYNGFSTLIR